MNKLRRLVPFELMLLLICFYFSTISAWAQYDGNWGGTTNQSGGDVSFTVSGSNIEDFKIDMYVCWAGCTWVTQTIFTIPKSGNSFSHSDASTDITGTFTSPTTCSGTWDYFEPTFLLSGSGTWTANIETSSPVLSVTPDYRNVSPDSGSTTFDVSNTGVGTMSWIAEVNPADTWLTITGGSSGTDSGTITVSYEENEGAQRIGAINVTAVGADNSPKTVELRQDAFDGAVEWSGTTEPGAYGQLGSVTFTVNGTSLQNLQITTRVCSSTGCGCTWATTNFLVDIPISGDSFVFTGSSGLTNFTGTFTSATTCAGTWEFDEFGLCRYQGSGTWTANIEDTDEDGISDDDEINIYGTDPDDFDSDDDNINDGDELDYWGEDWNTNYDGDGITNNLLDSDADGDGSLDGDEINSGYDPSDPNDYPPWTTPTINEFATAYGSEGSDMNYVITCDLDGDGDVDGNDLAEFAAGFE